MKKLESPNRLFNIFSDLNLNNKDVETKKIEIQSLEVEINGKMYKRPILKTYNMGVETFEVTERYQIKKILGSGTYGLVVLAYDSEKKKDVAIKKIKNTFTQDLLYQKRILREIKVMRHIQQVNQGNGHPNIINILDLIPPKSFDEFQDIYIVMDCMPFDLKKFMGSKNNHYTEENTRYFIYNILCGIYGIHSANILHRDLTPSNILLDEDVNIKICDFGLARGLEENHKMSTPYVVARWYRSPELLLGYESANKPLDMWSVGCIMAELIQEPNRRPLFPGESVLGQVKLILDFCGKQNKEDVKGVRNAVTYVMNIGKKEKEEIGDHPKFKHIKDKNCLDLLDKLLQFNPDKRITVEEALHHPYFKEVFDEEDLIKIPKFDFDIDEKTDYPDLIKEIIYHDIMAFNKKLGIAGDAILSDSYECVFE